MMESTGVSHFSCKMVFSRLRLAVQWTNFAVRETAGEHYRAKGRLPAVVNVRPVSKTELEASWTLLMSF